MRCKVGCDVRRTCHGTCQGRLSAIREKELEIRTVSAPGQLSSYSSSPAFSAIAISAATAPPIQPLQELPLATKQIANTPQTDQTQ
eukprot:2629266-Rhodomonas_salina.1